MRHLIRAEWTKVRTVPGWTIALLLSVLATIGLGVLTAAGNHSSCGGASTVCPPPPLGPDGTAVDDHFFFVHRALAGDGSITVRLSSMTGQRRLPDASPGVRRVASGLVPWAKAGIMVKDGTRPGASYAALMATGTHGVRLQYDFSHDVAGSASRVGAGTPRWLRVVRTGRHLTGYESADGHRWTRVGTASLPGLPTRVQIGLFAASPGALRVARADLGGSVETISFSSTTARFDHVGLDGTATGGWHRTDVGATVDPDGSVHHPGAARWSAGRYTVTGVGDIAPRVDGMTVEKTLSGLLVGLLIVIVVAAGFVAAEYRTGLVRTTLTTDPRRGRVLGAKAVVLAGTAFVAGLAATAATLPIGTHVLRANGNTVLPVDTLTVLRIVVGTGLLVALIAVLVLALATLLRRASAAIAAGVALVLVPRILATTSVLPDSAAQWVLRLTPAAGFAIQQSIPTYRQVTAHLVPQAGYYPLPPWAGLAVTAGYAAVALLLAVVVLRRRDA
jgi:ABC-type transport system involved in multi-copper enzyme maturation permease subunit